MTRDEYVKKVQSLERELRAAMDEYIETNKKYNEGDYLRVSFQALDGEQIVRTCKIVNIYPKPNIQMDLNVSYSPWPTGELIHFARYAWKTEDGKVRIGDHCPLGSLSGRRTICHYPGIDESKVKIEVITEDELEVEKEVQLVRLGD